MYTLLYTYIAVSHLIYLLVKRNMNVVHNSLASNKQTSVENPSIKPLTSIKAFYQYHQEPPERQRYCQANQRHKVTVYNPYIGKDIYVIILYIILPRHEFVVHVWIIWDSYGIPMKFLWDSYGFLGLCLRSPDPMPVFTFRKTCQMRTLEIPGDLAETSSGDVLFT